MNTDRFLSKAKVKYNGLGFFSGDWIEGAYTYSEYSDKHFMTVEVPGNPKPYFATIEIEPSTLCQCTGLKDKNGKLIFEGDIVDYNCLSAFAKIPMFVDSTVYFHELRNTWAVKRNSFSNNDLWVYTTGKNKKNETEIIGNIHDKKEEVER